MIETINNEVQSCPKKTNFPQIYVFLMTCFQLIIYTIDAEFVYRFLNHQTE